MPLPAVAVLVRVVAVSVAVALACTATALAPVSVAPVRVAVTVACTATAAALVNVAAAELSIKNLGTFVPITATAAEQTQFLADSQNLLVKAAGASTLDVDKLGAAMLAAGGQAKASGVDYQDFVTTMGMISPSFDSAATAGTSYKNFLARLQPTTKSAMDAMTSLNLVTADGKSKFFDATGAFVGNREAAAMLQKSLAGLSDAQRTAALQAIFGNDAMGAAVALANSGAAGYDKFAAAMANASGVEQTAKTVQQGFNIALDNMHGSIEALQIVVGTALLPFILFFL
jgi:TP901 family phage tail tape measure protein